MFVMLLQRKSESLRLLWQYEEYPMFSGKKEKKKIFLLILIGLQQQLNLSMPHPDFCKQTEHKHFGAFIDVLLPMY